MWAKGRSRCSWHVPERRTCDTGVSPLTDRSDGIATGLTTNIRLIFPLQELSQALALCKPMFLQTIVVRGGKTRSVRRMASMRSRGEDSVGHAGYGASHARISYSTGSEASFVLRKYIWSQDSRTTAGYQ